MDEVVEVPRLEDINALYSQIREHSNFLEKIDRIPFVDTPVHAAARTGNTDLVIEISRLKPSFTRKLNPDGFTPMHLALQNRQAQTVLQLLDIDSELVRVKGREGITPLHYASGKGYTYLLSRFLSVCPKSVEDLTNQGETALHIALKNDKVEAFEVLTERTLWPGGEVSQYCNKRIFNWKDKDGNTLLHIATSRNQVQVVRFLLDGKVDVNARNSVGRTALGILLLQTEPKNEQIENILRNAEARVLPNLLPTFDTYTHLRTDQRLNLAARVGNVDALYDLILEDVHLLDRIDQVPFIDTPLHIAASAGHVQFALEIMRLKPLFARKQNQSGFSPLHLALQSNPTQTEMALRLIHVDRSLIRIRGKGGITPLHYVAGKGFVDLLTKFLVACPDCIQDVTLQKENALHVAAKNGKLEALDVLINWIHYVGKDEILIQTDGEGNNLLHIAVFQSHGQMVKMVKRLINRVPINVPNSDGMTPLDQLEDHIQGLPVFEKLKLKLWNASTLKRSSFPKLNIAQALTKRLTWLERRALFNYRRKVCIAREDREAVLVVAVLIATATYQAALSPSEFDDPIGKLSSGSPPDQDTDYEEPHVIRHYITLNLETFSNQIFLYLNIIAFCISMSVIHNFLPQANARLVYPLVLCFLSLMALRSYFSLTGSIVILLGIWSPSLVPPISRYLRCCTGYQDLRPIFKHYRSSE